MSLTDFCSDTKYCPQCKEYVRYLRSLESCFCVDCGSKVHLFSKKDRRIFQRHLLAQKKKAAGAHRKKNVS